MRSLSLLLAFLLASFCTSAARAETVKDRKGAVLGDRAAMEGDARWLYNDTARGFAEARRAGKPLLVVLRCVPCLACAGIDARVLERESELAPLLERFVCLRVINANALDLSLFQFDYDLSFSALIFHGDGTVLGRYGSWRHQKDAQDKTTAGLRAGLEAALALHARWPADKAALAGKQGAPLPFKTPLEMPSIAGKYPRELDWSGQVVQSCVHCHQIGDALRLSFREKKQPIPSAWIYPWPAPEVIGLTLAAEHPARVEAVSADSPAARAGMRAGDDLTAIAGQQPISIADVSWALHGAPEAGPLPIIVKRAGAEQTVRVELPAGWRSQADISRRVGTWPLRAMALGGLLLEDLDDAERARRGLDGAALALRVQHLGEYGTHAAAKKAGFKKDDVLVEIAGLAQRLSESALLGHLLQEHSAGEKVRVVVRRGDERIELALPMQ